MAGAFLILVPFVPYAALELSSAGGPTLGPAPAELGLNPSAHPFCPVGAPGGPDTGGPPSPLSARAVRERSRPWEWKALETPGWKLLRTDRAVLRGDVGLDVLRASGAYAEVFLDMLSASLGGDASGIVFSLRLFSEERDFRRYACRVGASNAESFYDPRTAEVVLRPDGARGEAWLQKTLAHELTHAYMDRVWRRTGPLWFAEGMAEYFSNFSVRNGRVCPGAVDRRALLLVRLQDAPSLARLVELGREEMYGPEFPARYAQAWSFVHYLFWRNDGLVDLLLRGGRLERLEELERDWKNYVARLDEGDSSNAAPENRPAPGRLR